MILTLFSVIIAIVVLFILENNPRKILALAICYLSFLFLILLISYENKINVEIMLPIFGFISIIFAINLLLFAMIINKTQK